MLYIAIYPKKQFLKVLDPLLMWENGQFWVEGEADVCVQYVKWFCLARGQGKETYTQGDSRKQDRMEGSEDQHLGVGPAVLPLGAPHGSNSLALLLALN